MKKNLENKYFTKKAYSIIGRVRAFQKPDLDLIKAPDPRNIEIKNIINIWKIFYGKFHK